jgi:hypothetical protein
MLTIIFGITKKTHNQGGTMKDNKTKEFTNYIKQDFDIVKDYKNASKELTAKEALSKIINTKTYEEKDNGHYETIGTDNPYETKIVFQALTELEKRDTPMKATYGWKDGRMVNIDCPNCNQSINATPFCPHCGKTLDWEKE